LAARGHGTHQLDPAAMARFQGGRVPDTIGAILGWLGLGDRIDGLEAVAITGAVIAYVSAAFVADPAPITGAVSTVRALHAAGVPMAVASSSAASFIDAALDAMDLGAAFPVRVSALPLPAGKPDPSVYRLALDQLGLPATLALAVEDSPVGVFAAVNANLTCFVGPAGPAGAPHAGPAHRPGRRPGRRRPAGARHRPVGQARSCAERPACPGGLG